MSEVGVVSVGVERVGRAWSLTEACRVWQAKLASGFSLVVEST